MSTPAPVPEPAISGSFAIFPLPSGAVIMVLRLAGDEGERRMEIPAALAAVGRALAEEGGLSRSSVPKVLRALRAAR